MRTQEDSIWYNINLCIEIALNIYYICGARGEGLAVPREYAKETFSPETMAAGEEEGSWLYYPQGEPMDMLQHEIEGSRETAAGEIQPDAAGQTEDAWKREAEAAPAEMPPEEADEDDYGEQADYGLEI